MLYSDADIERIRMSTDIQSVVTNSKCPKCGRKSLIVDSKKRIILL